MNAVKTYFIDVLKNHYVDFKGRATRQQYWMFVLFYFILSIVIGIIGAICSDTVNGILSTLLTLGLFLPSLGIGVRRLHDTDRSGWWYLLILLPFIGGLVLLVFFCLPGTEGENRFNK
ncbi:MAG: DUF805 domain-containing protein [Elusimicrobia bacterium]|nr:DUF805 domain-containing protein [Elusimicrobiota bacterium]MDY6039829.1 DUF805 domain-containing protein [Elusimicrobiaceae bacterium]